MDPTRLSDTTRKGANWLKLGGWLAVGLLLLSIAGGHNASAEPQANQEQLVVQTTTLMRQTLRREIVSTGSVRSYEEVVIQPRIVGFVEKWTADIGDRVKKGDVLAQLSVPEAEKRVEVEKIRVLRREAEVKQAKIAVLAAEAEIKVGEAKKQEAMANVSRAEALHARWDKEYKREAELLKNGKRDMEQQPIDETLNNLKAAEADLNTAKAKLATIQATQEVTKANRDKAAIAVEIAQANLEEAKMELTIQRDWLDFAILRAPFDGVITRRNVNTGQLFVVPPTPMSAGNPDDAAFTIMRTDMVRVALEVPEKDAVFVKDGANAILRLPAYKNQVIDCKVTRTSWSLDPKTRGLRVEIFLDNPKGELRSGMTANATILADIPNVWTLPANVVLNDGEANYCFIVEGGKATRLNLLVGTSGQDLIQVVAKQAPSAKPGEEGKWVPPTGSERVIVSKLRSIKEGQSVKVKD